VTRELIDSGLPASRVFAAAFGDQQPIAANTDEDGRARNRPRGDGSCGPRSERVLKKASQLSDSEVQDAVHAEDEAPNKPCSGMDREQLAGQRAAITALKALRESWVTESSFAPCRCSSMPSGAAMCRQALP
jgi:SRSO17 transposase